MTCHNCQSLCKKFGKHRNGLQRFRCKQCGRTVTEDHKRPLDEMRIPLEKALLCLNLLVEGNSVRSTERISGVHRDTILDLLLKAGARCERLLSERVKGVAVSSVQADELWAYVGMKEKTKKKKDYATEKLGDAYTFVAIERNSKLVLAWHLGRRSRFHTEQFIDKLDRATSGRFQLTTDGFGAYPDAVSYALGTRTDYAQLVKVYANPVENEKRYSPAEVIAAIPTPFWGDPFPENISTSHIERQNLTMRMMMRRLTRLTNAFSKKWENLRAALALHFAYYNFCRIHSTIRCTPAMEAGITGHIWELRELIS
jgi:transposase-like protein/IS1 family transposase